jgi:hypothetical protein
MDGIVIGHFPMSNTLLVYNPRNPQYYGPNIYCIDPYHLTSSIYANIKYDGGLSCHLLCNNNSHMEEKNPPGTGTLVKQLDSSTNILLSGTVMYIPFPATSLAPDILSTDLNYTILFDNGTTSSIPLWLWDMASLIP